MKKMTPREALYYICLELGPMSEAQTNRSDNLNAREVRLRDSIRALQNFIDYHDDTTHRIPDSANEYVHHDDYVPRPTKRGDGKERIETWKKESKVYTTNTVPDSFDV
jgi:hypothetical protein